MWVRDNPPPTSPATEAPPVASATPLMPSNTPVPPSPSPLPPTPTETAIPLGINYINPQRYLVEYLVKVSNDGFNLSELRVYQQRPVVWDAQADLFIEEVQPEPSVEGTDSEHGNGMYYWKVVGQPKGGRSLTFKLLFRSPRMKRGAISIHLHWNLMT